MPWVTKLFSFSLFLLFSLSIKGFSQERCATVLQDNALKKKNPTRETTQEFENWLKQKQLEQKLNPSGNNKTEDFAYSIPVVVHVLYNTDAQNISDAQIQSQIDVLNKDFQRLNTDASSTHSEFVPVASSLSINFILAKQDPDGLPSTGITRRKIAQSGFTSSNADGAILKSYDYWPAENYVNIWVINFTDTYLGYAQFPVSSTLSGIPTDLPSDRLTDGLVIKYNVFGTADAGSYNLISAYNKGRTVTHEMGHFLGGLRHIWGDTSDCSGTDYVDDTPNQQFATNSCPTTKLTSCGVNNMYQNYMDYTYDACMNLYTAGQISRMKTVLANSPRRLSLLTSPGLIPPTNLGTDIKLVSIDSPSPVFCNTQTQPIVTIKNQGSQTITKFTAILGVNSSTVTQEITGISLLSGEQKQFTLQQLSFTSGSNTLTITLSEPNGFTDSNSSNNSLSLNLVVNTSSDIIPYRQNFDGNYPDWVIVSQGKSMKWVSSATNKSLSLSFNAFSNTVIGDQSWLVSPTLNLSSNTKASVFFDVSYATRNSQQDNLTIFTSTDCGVTFNTSVYNKSGTELSSITSSTSWAPQTDSDWSREYVNLTSLVGQNNVRLAFVASNDSGNNIFIDNIEFFTDDKANPVTAQTPYSIYSSSSTDFNLTFNLTQRQNVHLLIFNIMGQLITDQQLYDILNQTYQGDLSLQASGVYIVRMEIGGQFYATKVLIAH